MQGFWEKIRGIGLPVLWETLGGFLCGLLFAGAELGGMSSPIPAAVAGCLHPIAAAAVLIGALLSGIAAQTLPQQLSLIFSLLLVVSVRILLREKCTGRFISIATGCCVLVAGSVITFLQQGTLEGILVHSMSAVLTGTTAFFMHTVLHRLLEQQKIPLRSSVGCAAAVVYLILIAACSSFSFSLVNPGCMLGVAVTLLGAQRFRYTGGVICGALTTCGVMLAASDLGMALLFLPITGMLAGYMTNLGSFGMAGIFFLLNALAQLTIPTGALTYAAIGNLLLGCITYLLLHTVCLDQWIVTEQSDSVKLMYNLSQRLQFMAQAIGSVRMDTQQIAEILERHEATTDLSRQVCLQVCRTCTNRRICWQQRQAETQAAFAALQTQPGLLQRRTMPPELSDCIRKRQLLEGFLQLQRRSVRQRERQLQRTECRTVLFEQMQASEELLCSIGERMAAQYSAELTQEIERRLEKFGYGCDSIVAYYNDRDRLMIAFYCKQRQLEGCMPAVCHILSEMLNLTLEELEPVGTKESMQYRLCEMPPYALSQYSVRRCADSSGISGDTTVQFRDGFGCAYVVLSDGMGTGREAAMESRMTAEMFRKLISSGISYPSALRLINGLMLTKSAQERFATLDAARFDLDSGELTLIKSGAASTLLRHQGKVVRICAPTFPIGTAPVPDYYTQTIALEADDILVMLSDGVLESQYPFIKDLLLKSDDLSYIAREIGQNSAMFHGGHCRDDVSITVVQIQENLSVQNSCQNAQKQKLFSV